MTPHGATRSRPARHLKRGSRGRPRVHGEHFMRWVLAPRGSGHPRERGEHPFRHGNLPAASSYLHDFPRNRQDRHPTTVHPNTAPPPSRLPRRSGAVSDDHPDEMGPTCVKAVAGEDHLRSPGKRERSSASKGYSCRKIPGNRTPFHIRARSFEEEGGLPSLWTNPITRATATARPPIHPHPQASPKPGQHARPSVVGDR